MALFKTAEENRKLLDELNERIKTDNTISLNDIREHFGLRRLNEAQFNMPLSSFECYGDPVKEANLQKSMEYQPTEEDLMQMDIDEFEELMLS